MRDLSYPLSGAPKNAFFFRNFFALLFTAILGGVLSSAHANGRIEKRL